MAHVQEATTVSESVCQSCNLQNVTAHHIFGFTNYIVPSTTVAAAVLYAKCAKYDKPPWPPTVVCGTASIRQSKYTVCEES